MKVQAEQGSYHPATVSKCWSPLPGLPPLCLPLNDHGFRRLGELLLRMYLDEGTSHGGCLKQEWAYLDTVKRELDRQVRRARQLRIGSVDVEIHNKSWATLCRDCVTETDLFKVDFLMGLGQLAQGGQEDLVGNTGIARYAPQLRIKIGSSVPTQSGHIWSISSFGRKL